MNPGTAIAELLLLIYSFQFRPAFRATTTPGQPRPLPSLIHAFLNSSVVLLVVYTVDVNVFTRLWRCCRSGPGVHRLPWHGVATAAVVALGNSLLLHAALHRSRHTGLHSSSVALQADNKQIEFHNRGPRGV